MREGKEGEKRGGGKKGGNGAFCCIFNFFGWLKRE